MYEKGFQKTIIQSIEDYIQILEYIYDPEKIYWFRGQCNAIYMLMPSALRRTYAIRDSRGYEYEKPFLEFPGSGSNNEAAILPVIQMVEEFKREVSSYIHYIVKNNIEWECIAQHYGLPTRMLDWTTDPLIALYFAVCDCEIGNTKEEDYDSFFQSGYSGGGGAIYIIDPKEINRETISWNENAESKVLDIDFYEKYIEHNMENLGLPLCIEGNSEEQRICRQSGKFTTTSNLLWPLDYYDKLKPLMIKIFIPYTAYPKIRTQLTELKITRDTVYIRQDTKDEIARRIADEIKNKFERAMNKR